MTVKISSVKTTTYCLELTEEQAKQNFLLLRNEVEGKNLVTGEVYDMYHAFIDAFKANGVEV
jgi:hypothetical protein